MMRFGSGERKKMAIVIFDYSDANAELRPTTDSPADPPEKISGYDQIVNTSAIL